MKRRVIKLGGSLLTLPVLKQGFKEWCSRQPEAQNLIIVGGGGLVEAVREVDAIHSLSAEQTHWMAIELMHNTCQLASAILDVPELLSDPASLQKWLELPYSSSTCRRTSLVSSLAYMSALSESDLPVSWEVTSDSIAAWLAKYVGASELVLLKSGGLAGRVNDGDQCKWLSSDDRDQLSAKGVVDPLFPQFASGLERVGIAVLPAPSELSECDVITNSGDRV